MAGFVVGSVFPIRTFESATLHCACLSRALPPFQNVSLPLKKCSDPTFTNPFFWSLLIFSPPIPDEASVPSPSPTSGPNTYMTPNHTGSIHLWQFLKELLLQPDSYGYCIRWLDRPQGMYLWWHSFNFKGTISSQSTGHGIRVLVLD